MDYMSPGKPFRVFWLERDGQVVSFRVGREEATAWLASMRADDWSLIVDPFRKGAPVGGFVSLPSYKNIQKGESYDIGIQSTSSAELSEPWGPSERPRTLREQVDGANSLS